MIARANEALTGLYETDETAWLDAMAELIRAGQLGDVDYPHLAEYLEDMATRDRREVKSRLKILIAHVLKWIYQKEMRTPSWRATINVQRDDLEDELQTSKSLRNHAEAILAEAYAKALQRAADETGLPAATFPPECPWSLEQLLSPEVLDT